MGTHLLPSSPRSLESAGPGGMIFSVGGGSETLGTSASMTQGPSSASDVPMAVPAPPTWLQEKYVLVPVFEFTSDVADLLRELLRLDPDDRLGGVLRPARPFLRDHQFFSGVDWVRECLPARLRVCARMCVMGS